ncbi:MAG TPA: transporter [Pseudomonadales bacterium]
MERRRFSRHTRRCVFWCALGLAGTAGVARAESEAPVGEAPEETAQTPVVFADRSVRGVLTPGGVTVMETSLTYSHSTSTAVAIEGFTIIPALVVGLINVQQTQRDTLVSAISMRRGFGNRFEAEVYLPYVVRHEDIRQREILDGSAADVITDTDGHGLGDVEASLRYQLNRGWSGGPLWILNLRVKSRTGEGPFDVDRETLFTDDGERIGDVLLEQPTGSGFWGFQPSLTMVYPTEPGVLYGNVSYFWNQEKRVDGVGEVDPGDAIGLSLGMGFAINSRTAFNLGYEHNVVLKSSVENDSGIESVFDYNHVGLVTIGASQRLSRRFSLNVSIGIGATEAAPDVQIALRIPTAF